MCNEELSYGYNESAAYDRGRIRVRLAVLSFKEQTLGHTWQIISGFNKTNPNSAKAYAIFSSWDAEGFRFDDLLDAEPSIIEDLKKPDSITSFVANALISVSKFANILDSALEGKTEEYIAVPHVTDLLKTQPTAFHDLSVYLEAARDSLLKLSKLDMAVPAANDVIDGAYSELAKQRPAPYGAKPGKPAP